ncbi:MAG: hypothetical protein AMXMBFR64_27420 [Myxococcales bacterium]
MRLSSLRSAFLSFGATQTLWALPAIFDDFTISMVLLVLLPGLLYIGIGANLARCQVWSHRIVEWPPQLFSHVFLMMAVVMGVASLVLPGVDHRSTESSGDYLGAATVLGGVGALHLVLWLFARKVNRLVAAIAEADVSEKMPRVAAMDAH